MLEIKDLHVQFHTSDHEAVRGIDLTVQDGEILGLVGESGSGKTVTAMMVSGLLRRSRRISGAASCWTARICSTPAASASVPFRARISVWCFRSL